MVNVKEFLLKYVKENIPRDILEYGIREEEDSKEDSLDSLIIDKVIEPIVLRDLNLHGGVQISIDLKHCDIEILNNMEARIFVPKSLTTNRTIITPLHIVMDSFLGVGSARLVNRNHNQFAYFSKKVLRSVSSNPFNTTSDLTLIGENTILARCPNFMSSIRNGRLVVEVEHMGNFETIGSQYSHMVGELAVLASKFYIYNNRIIDLNKGEIYAGHELGVIKDIIDNYSGSKEEYDEKIKKWRKFNLVNNTEFRKMALRLAIGGNN